MASIDYRTRDTTNVPVVCAHVFHSYQLSPYLFLPVETSGGLQGELDELEREEFFRLKKVQAKKKRDSALQDAEVIHCNMPLFLPDR